MRDVLGSKADKALVMVVDDDEDIRDAFAQVLGDEGWRVVCAQNGRDALDKLRETDTPPGVIFLDFMMPVMNGLEFRHEQLRDPQLARIPVVAMTAFANVPPPEGISVMRKPFHFADVVSIVERYCRAGAAGSEQHH